MNAIAARDGEVAMTEIIDLLHRYAWSLDKGQTVNMPAVFTESVTARVEVAGNVVADSWRGRASVIDGLLGIRDAYSRWRSQQLTTPLFLAVNATRATLRSYLSLFAADRGQTPQIAATGEYRVEVSKVEGKWVIDRLELILDCDIAA